MYRMGTEKLEEALKNLAAMYRLAGIQEAEIKKRLQVERRKQKELYAYLIMHNMGMPISKRRKLILKMDKKEGHQLFFKNIILFIKEKIAAKIKKIAIWK